MAASHGFSPSTPLATIPTIPGRSFEPTRVPASLSEDPSYFSADTPFLDKLTVRRREATLDNAALYELSTEELPNVNHLASGAQTHFPVQA